MCLSVSCKKKSNADLALPTLPDAKSNISVWCSPIYSPPRQAGKDKQNKPGGTMQKSVVHCVSVYLCPGSNQSQFGTWFGSWKSFLTVILVHSCYRDAWKSTVYNVKTVSTESIQISLAISIGNVQFFFLTSIYQTGWLPKEFIIVRSPDQSSFNTWWFLLLKRCE